MPSIMSPMFSHRVQSTLSPLPGIKNIIAVGSGKGGVGKSTIAFHLAHTLIAQGYQVGLVDADIYGPSLPVLTGVLDRATVRQDKKFQPHFHKGLYFLSIGHLVDEQAAMIWRGPMACGALLQLFQSVAWPALDFLIVDLPPGTGDLLLTLCQKIPLTGVVLVTHPHKLAYADYIRAQAMFRKMEIFELGVILNHFEEHDFPYENVLATIPYSPPLRDAANHSQALDRNHHSALISEFEKIAQLIIMALSKRPLALKIPMKILNSLS